MNTQHRRDDQKNRRSFAKDLVEKVNKKIVPVFLLISVIISICMLVIGCLNIHKCPVNKCIPVFLIATGAMGVISKIFSFVRKKNVNFSNLPYVKRAETVLYFAEVIFLFLGTYWVVKEFQPNFEEPEEKTYCNKTAYMFALLYLTVHYTLLIIAIFGLLGLMCCIAAPGSVRDSYNLESPPTTCPETAERLTLTGEFEIRSS